MRQRPKPLKSEAKLPVVPKPPKNQTAKVRDLEKRLAESLERETATSEILRVISSSPTDVQPVFDTIAAHALRLCVAPASGVYRFDGELIHVVALRNIDPAGVDAVRQAYPRPPTRGGATGRAILTRDVVYIRDIGEDPEYQLHSAAAAVGYRSIMSVPMLRGQNAIGAITVNAADVAAFSDDHVKLLQAFADQAVIAIENVRLFNETKEALEQQTATGDILKVIASSPTDIQPVLDALAESAARLCESFDSAIFRRDGERLLLVAHHGPIPVASSLPLVRGSVNGRAVLDGQPVHIADLQAKADEFPEGSALTRGEGVHAHLSVPLMREGVAIGTINLRRTEAQLFTDRQVALLQTFADQAVIAIENVRLFNETKEALEQQTATTDILRVISSSPTDVQPVFDAIAANAVRLCGAMWSAVIRFDGELMHLVSLHKLSDPEGEEAVRRAFPRPPSRAGATDRAILTTTTAYVPDVREDREYQHQGLAQAAGYRSHLSVPMLREGQPVGAITVAGATPEAFSERQISLLKTFADQAVIAIENVRLFTELQVSNRELTTALDTQTATSDILRVISRSQTDVQPVFDTILASAVRLLRGYSGLVTRTSGDQIVLAALTSTDASGDAAVRAAFPHALQSEFTYSQAIRNRAPLNIADAYTDPRFPETEHARSRARGYRSRVVVPMLGHDQAVGAIGVTRREPGGFTDDEIALLQTFADQAVIAIENVRLFTELQDKNRALTDAHAQVSESLEQQTATAEILSVISGSPTDIRPVFDAVLDRALTLCEASNGSLYQLEDGALRHVGLRGPHLGIEVGGVFPLTSSPGRAVLEKRTVHLEDILQELDWHAPEIHAGIRRTGIRTIVAVPLLREQTAIGAILIRRLEVRPFSGKQIRLLQTFADQAVIAIENVRLFTELQASNRELTTALDTQTATSDILRVISRSQTDVQPVFDAIVASAVRLLRGYTSALARIARDQIELAALTSTDDAGDAALRARYPQSLQSEWTTAQAIRERAPLNIADAPTDPRVSEAGRAMARVRGYRSLVVVPLLRHDEAVGAISVTRREPGGFHDDEIALLQTFADQAVIAIENARLLTELHARTAELTQSVGELRALGEVGQAISSTLDLQTVLKTIVARATQLSGTDAGVIYEYDEQREVFVPRATEHLEADIVETMLATPVRKGEGATGRLAEIQEPIQVPDILAAPAESRVRGALVRAGYRALLAVPLVREDHLLGGLTVIRKATGEFASEVIELLQTFATQSALAIQNARLFREIEEKSRQLEVASQHKSEFLANMSHELRTPLNAIIGFSEVLSERMFGELNEKQEEYSKDIHASGQHLLSLINDILDLSKIEAGRMELELTDFHLPTALDNALTLVRERAGRRSIALQMSVDERLGEVRADERKIRQVVLNLLSNAIKFTPEGGRIEVGAVPKDGSVEVSISDTGVGIAPEDQEAVFEEFRQVGGAEKKAEGTGLGLTLCRKFIELHGGRIWVMSQVGVGSTFTFTIPVRRGE